MHLTITEAAKALNVTRQTLSELANGRVGVSAEMAMRLAKAFKTPSEMWINLQSQYELWQAKGIDLRAVKCLIYRE